MVRQAPRNVTSKHGFDWRRVTLVTQVPPTPHLFYPIIDSIFARPVCPASRR